VISVVLFEKPKNPLSNLIIHQIKGKLSMDGQSILKKLELLIFSVQAFIFFQTSEFQAFLLIHSNELVAFFKKSSASALSCTPTSNFLFSASIDLLMSSDTVLVLSKIFSLALSKKALTGSRFHA